MSCQRTKENEDLVGTVHMLHYGRYCLYGRYLRTVRTYVRSLPTFSYLNSSNRCAPKKKINIVPVLCAKSHLMRRVSETQNHKGLAELRKI